MRVTNSATYRNFTSSVNDVHAQLNRSMNKISSGKQYENAAESPLSYYRGKRIDDQYQDALSKSNLLTDIKNRIYQHVIFRKFLLMPKTKFRKPELALPVMKLSKPFRPICFRRSIRLLMI